MARLDERSKEDVQADHASEPGATVAPPPAARERPAKPRLDDLTILRGIGIFLVVFGHIGKGDHPPSQDWYFDLRTLIYAFHMPLFLYISGFLLLRSQDARPGWAATFGHIGKRAERLLVPFAVFGLLIVVGKHIATPYASVDNVHASFGQDLLFLIVHTSASSALSVWYLFVVFVAGAFALIFRMVSRSTPLLLAIAVAFSFMPVGDVAYMDRVALYSPFFVLGMLASEHETRWLRLIERHVVVFGLVFAAALVVTRWGTFQEALYLCGITAAPFLHGLSRRIVGNRRARVLLQLGTFSMAIYLLNTVAIGVTKSVWVKLTGSIDTAFAGYVVAALAVGLLLPIAVKVFVFRRLRYVDRMTS